MSNHSAKFHQDLINIFTNPVNRQTSRQIHNITSLAAVMIALLHNYWPVMHVMCCVFNWSSTAVE